MLQNYEIKSKLVVVLCSRLLSGRHHLLMMLGRLTMANCGKTISKMTHFCCSLGTAAAEERPDEYVTMGMGNLKASSFI